MNAKKCSKCGFVVVAALLGALTGCVTHVHESDRTRGYAPPPPVYVEGGAMVQEGYVYYPGYQVYYSSTRRQYIYQEGRSWVTRSTPRHVSVQVLVASPSVRLDFHDSPAAHHAKVVKQYPKHWAPPGSSPNHGQGK
jgi:hypothetical protein